MVIPQDFERDLRKYSRNIDFSYFAPSLGLGTELESNLIHAPGSFIPRSLDMNLTAALDGTGNPINIGEIGGRIEGLEPMIAQLFGPAGYFKKSSYNKIFYDLISFLKKNWSKIQQELEVSIRERRSLDYESLKNVFNKLYGSHSGQVEADVFARLMGQEISYASWSKRLQDISADAMIDDIIQYITQALAKMKTMDKDLARAAQMGVDYSFPTIHGTPLKVKMDAMVVIGIKVKTNFEDNSDNEKLKILPSLSIKTHGFIGYDAHLIKSGIKMNANVTSTNGVAIKVRGGREMEIEVDIPNKMEILHVDAETYLMKRKQNMPDTKILPPSMQDIRFEKKSCINALEQVFGIKMCYDLNVPNVFRANSLPLGSHAHVKLSINKTESSIKGWKIAVTSSSESQVSKYAYKVSVVGASSPKEAQVEVLLKKESDSYLTAVKLESAVCSSEAKVILINRPEYKSVQADIAHKTDNTDFSKAIKIDLKISREGDATKYEINAFGANSRDVSEESKQFTAELTTKPRTPWTMVDVSAETKNAFMQLIPLRFKGGFLTVCLLSQSDHC